MIKIKIDEIGSIKTVENEIGYVKNKSNIAWGTVREVNFVIEVYGMLDRCRIEKNNIPLSNGKGSITITGNYDGYSVKLDSSQPANRYSGAMMGVSANIYYSKKIRTLGETRIRFGNSPRPIFIGFYFKIPEDYAGETIYIKTRFVSQ